MKKVISLFILIIGFYTSKAQDVNLIKDTILFTQMIRVSQNNIVQASFAFFIINGKYYNGNNFPYLPCFKDDTSHVGELESYFALKKTLKNERNWKKVFRKINRRDYFPIYTKKNKETFSKFYNCMKIRYLDTIKSNEFFTRSIQFIGYYFFMDCDMNVGSLRSIFCPEILEGDKIPIVLKIDKFLR